MKIAVYTALYGNKDVIRPPLNYSEEDPISYFVFSEKERVIEPYKTIIRPAKYNDIAKNARYIKILGDSVLADYNLLIWHDANIQLDHSEIKNLVALASKTFLTTFAHPNRDDFYSETMTCIRVNKDFSLRLLYQAFVYFMNGMPAHQGMFATGILIKNHTYSPKKILEFWWQQIMTYSRRDQLALAYTVYKQKTELTLIHEDILDNRYSKYYLHNHNYYEEKHKIMNYNFWIFKKISFYGVQLMRKLKKTL